jgi:hypothetical protein
LQVSFAPSPGLTHMTDVETVVSQQSSYNLADSSAESVSTSAFAAHSRTSSFVSISSPSSVGSLSSSSMGDRTSTTNVEMVAPSVLPIEGERNAKFFFDDDHVTFCVSLLPLISCPPLTCMEWRFKDFYTVYMAISSRASRKKRVVLFRTMSVL